MKLMFTETQTDTKMMFSQISDEIDGWELKH